MRSVSHGKRFSKISLVLGGLLSFVTVASRASSGLSSRQIISSENVALVASGTRKSMRRTRGQVENSITRTSGIVAVAAAAGTITSCPAFCAWGTTTGLSSWSPSHHCLRRTNSIFRTRSPTKNISIIIDGIIDSRILACSNQLSICSSSRSRASVAKMGAFSSNNPGEGRGRDEGGLGRPRKRRPLALLSQALNDAILEMCVENKGRPLAMAMTDLVERTIEALASGYSLEALLLELQYLDSTTRVPGETLTGVEKRYRTQWVGALHAVMQNLNFVEEREPKSAEEFHLKSQVDVVLQGRRTKDEQTFVKLDKALATGGVAGGVATERIVVAPQMVPISQLVLLAIRALQKLERANG